MMTMTMINNKIKGSHNDNNDDINNNSNSDDKNRNNYGIE